MTNLETIMMATITFTIEFTQLTEDGEGYWFTGKAGDYQWSLAEFGMSWGIAPTFREAYANAMREIEILCEDFDMTPIDNTHSQAINAVDEF
jgi:hypothetical protein